VNEAAARRVVLVQAFETAEPDGALWTAQDREWASRSAADEVPGRYIETRAEAAMQRLAPRLGELGRWLAQPLWRARWLMLVVAIGAAVGLAANVVGPSQRIDLLAPPVWAVVAWNLAVYALLLAQALAALRGGGGGGGRAARGPGPLRRFVLRLPRFGLVPAAGTGAGAVPGGSAGKAAAQAFASDWTRLSLPLTAARVALLLHLAAAALALGLIGGLYLRGLVLDYRAGWESTFLGADTVQALLSAVLAPAVAISGIALPDVAGIDALRTVPGTEAPAQPGNSAAPWIHLYALTLLLFVVLPRSLLVLASGGRALWLSRRFPLPLDPPYFQRLLRQRAGGAASVWVLPYAQTPDAPAALGLRALLAQVQGDAVQVALAPTVAFADEDALALPPAPPPGTSAVVALFDLAATPEAEHHGRFLRWLAAAPIPAVAVVDEGAFRRRFGGLPERLAERRAAWQTLAVAAGVRIVLVDLSQPDLARAAQAMQSAWGATA